MIWGIFGSSFSSQWLKSASKPVKSVDAVHIHANLICRRTIQGALLYQSKHTRHGKFEIHTDIAESTLNLSGSLISWHMPLLIFILLIWDGNFLEQRWKFWGGIHHVHLWTGYWSVPSLYVTRGFSTDIATGFIWFNNQNRVAWLQKGPKISTRNWNGPYLQFVTISPDRSAVYMQCSGVHTALHIAGHCRINTD